MVVTADAPVEVGLLGPLLVRRAGAAVAPGGPKPRGVLAVLALRAGQAVGLAELTDALWGPDAPPAATSSLRAHVSRLRAVIDPDRVGTLTAVGSGYRLALPPHALDVTRFGDLVRGGRAALDSGDARRAEALLTEGLALWRGPALADLLELPFAAPEAEQLRVHPGREWFTVLSGTVRLQLGERTSWSRQATRPSSRPWSRTPSAPTTVPSRSSPSSTTTASAPTWPSCSRGPRVGEAEHHPEGPPRGDAALGFALAAAAPLTPSMVVEPTGPRPRRQPRRARGPGCSRSSVP